VNVGEMLEMLSGGHLIATPHRVVNRGSDRYSFPYFMVPDHDVVIEPLVTTRSGFEPRSMPVGELSAEVWRTNWPDEQPMGHGFDLGSLHT
jgi:isopenicillin N synthase-like dioxygenase